MFPYIYTMTNTIKHFVFTFLVLLIVFATGSYTYNTSEKVVYTDTVTVDNNYGVPIEYITTTYTGFNTIDTSFYSMFSDYGSESMGDGKWYLETQIQSSLKYLTNIGMYPIGKEYYDLSESIQEEIEKDKQEHRYFKPLDNYGPIFLAVAYDNTGHAPGLVRVPVDSIVVEYDILYNSLQSPNPYLGELSGGFSFSPTKNED